MSNSREAFEREPRQLLEERRPCALGDGSEPKRLRRHVVDELYQRVRGLSARG